MRTKIWSTGVASCVKEILDGDEARQVQGKQTQGVVSAVKRSGTRERVRPPRNSTRATRYTRAAPQRTQFHQSIARELRGKDGIASNSRASNSRVTKTTKSWTV